MAGSFTVTSSAHFDSFAMEHSIEDSFCATPTKTCPVWDSAVQSPAQVCPKLNMAIRCIRSISHLSFQCTYAADCIAAGRHHGAFYRMFHCLSFRVVRRVVGEIHRAFHCKPHRISYRVQCRVGWDIVASLVVVGLNCVNSAMLISQRMVDFALPRACLVFYISPSVGYASRRELPRIFHCTVHCTLRRSFPRTLDNALDGALLRPNLPRILGAHIPPHVSGRTRWVRLIPPHIPPRFFSAGPAAGSANDSVKEIAERRRGPAPVYSTLQLAAPPITHTRERSTVHSIAYCAVKSTTLSAAPSMTHSRAACDYTMHRTTGGRSDGASGWPHGDIFELTLSRKSGPACYHPLGCTSPLTPNLKLEILRPNLNFAFPHLWRLGCHV